MHYVQPSKIDPLPFLTYYKKKKKNKGERVVNKLSGEGGVKLKVRWRQVRGEKERAIDIEKGN